MTTTPVTAPKAVQAILAKYSPEEILGWLQESTGNRYVQASHLVGVKETAELLAVGRTTVCNWQNPQRGLDYPEALTVLGRGPVHDGMEVLRWWKAWTPGRGNKAGELPRGLGGENVLQPYLVERFGEVDL